MSVRGERVVYRERERDSDGGRSEAPTKRTYTTVKRYQVPESTRSVFHGDEEEKDTKIVIRRERKEPSPPREEIDFKITERTREREREPPREEIDYRITERIREREREREAPRRDIAYRVIERDSDFDRRSAPRSEFRVVERDRETVRAPSPPSAEHVREYRFERERDFSPPRRQTQTLERPYDIERYSKSTEYFSQPQPAPQQIIIREAPAPQPIIIREERREPIVIREERREPIVIREERREPQYEFIERNEVEERSLVKREEREPEPPTPPPAPEPEPQQPEEENYFYERRVRQVDRPRQREQREESRDRRTEIRPRDSASQYSSDDSYEYVRRERTYEDDGRGASRSPQRRRHLAEGAIAGIGAAEILRHHRKSQGGPAGNRLRDGAAGAAVGAVGAEVLSRVRSRRRGSKSRSRSRSSSAETRRDRRSRKKRSRSRSKSLSRAQQIGGLAALAAVGALAGYAINKRGNKETVVVNNPPPRRSRSRRRRASVDSYATEALSEGGGRALDPEHRNRRIAQAGLASAAAAGIWDRVRSKSRGGRDRSKSRVRQGVPIAAAGLGGAALAGLYEKNKASKEAKKAAIIEEETGGRGRRRRSRSRSRSVPAPYPADDRSVDDRGLIAYGNEPIYPESSRGYYSDDEPGMYRRRHHGGSESGSSPDTRHRSRSRSRNLAGVGAAAGVAAVAAHEVGKRRERSRQREEADRRRRDDDRYDEPYGREHDAYSSPPMGGNSGYLPPQQSAPYDNGQAYPSSNYFPPPPTGDYATARNEPHAEQQNAYPAYNPADYAQGGGHQPYPQTYGAYGDSEANLGAPYPGGETYAGDPRYAAPTPDHAHEGARGRQNPDDVSSPNGSSAERESQDADGVSTPRAERSRSRSRVRFDLASNTEHSPEQQRKAKEAQRSSDSEATGDGQHRRRRKRRSDRGGDEEKARPSSQLMNDKYERGPAESDSDGTVELPSRFDEHGNRVDGGGDQLTNTITQLLGNAGIANLLGSLGGGGRDRDGGGGRDRDDDGGRSGRRRHRR